MTVKTSSAILRSGKMSKKPCMSVTQPVSTDTAPPSATSSSTAAASGSSGWGWRLLEKWCRACCTSGRRSRNSDDGFSYSNPKLPNSWCTTWCVAMTFSFSKFSCFVGAPSISAGRYSVAPSIVAWLPDTHPMPLSTSSCAGAISMSFPASAREYSPTTSRTRLNSTPAESLSSSSSAYDDSMRKKASPLSRFSPSSRAPSPNHVSNCGADTRLSTAGTIAKNGGTAGGATVISRSPRLMTTGCVV